MLTVLKLRLSNQPTQIFVVKADHSFLKKEYNHNFGKIHKKQNKFNIIVNLLAFFSHKPLIQIITYQFQNC